MFSVFVTAMDDLSSNEETASVSCSSNVSVLSIILRQSDSRSKSENRHGSSAVDNIHVYKKEKIMKYLKKDLPQPFCDILESRKFIGVYYFDPTVQKNKEHFPTIQNCTNSRDQKLSSYFKPIAKDHLCYRFEVIEAIGRGSYGTVIKAHDHKWGKDCAIKIFRDTYFSKASANHELKILKNLRNSESRTENIVDFYDYFLHHNFYCITFELLEGDLKKLLSIKNNQLHNKIIRCALRCVLEGLIFLHEKGLIHGDMKPDNIGYITCNEESDSYVFKILDLGMCISESQAETIKVIQTPIFRAPEVFLKAPYNSKIDIFSLGCTAAQLMKGSYLFQGKNDFMIMYEHVKLLGYPPRSLLEVSTNARAFFRITPSNVCIRYNRSKVNFQAGALKMEEVVKVYTDPPFINLLKSSLDMDPVRRPSAEELIRHPWLNEPDEVTLVKPHRTQKPFCVLF